MSTDRSSAYLTPPQFDEARQSVFLKQLGTPDTQVPISAAVAQTWMRDYNWTGRELVHHHTATVKDQVTIDSLQSIVAAVNAEVAAAQPRLKVQCPDSAQSIGSVQCVSLG